MKIRNILALPITTILDVCTLGELHITRNLMRSDADERLIDGLREINKALEAKQNDR